MQATSTKTKSPKEAKRSGSLHPGRCLTVRHEQRRRFYPNILYIDNFSTKYLMDKYPIYKTATLFTRKSEKNSYEQIIAPLLDELNEIPPEGFETNWSKRTTIKVKMIIDDAKVRAVIMKFLQHNGRFPCHRCYIEFDSKFLFPCIHPK